MTKNKRGTHELAHSSIDRLITGGTGFLGRALVKKLLADGCPRICIYSRNEFAQAKMRAELNDDPRLRWFIGDVRDVQRLERAMSSVYSVIHAAALKRIEVGAYNPDEMTKTNILGTLNVIEAARRAEIGKVILVSSDKAYQPVSPYGNSKAMAESLILNSNDPQYGPRFGVVRYGNVAGSTGKRDPDVARGHGEGRSRQADEPGLHALLDVASTRPRSSWSTRSFPEGRRAGDSGPAGLSAW
jgi:UDP-N-acetylglucosamine 4,6-dehydratase